MATVKTPIIGINQFFKSAITYTTNAAIIKIKNKTDQKYNREAIVIQKDASKSFFFISFFDLRLIIRLSAKRIKRLEISVLEFNSVSGKTAINKTNNKIL